MSDNNVLVAVSNRLGESAHWHEATEKLLWLDLLDAELFEYDPKTSGLSRHKLPLDIPLAGIVATTDPDVLIIGHRHGLSKIVRSTLEITPLCDPELGCDNVAFNDMKVDPFGRLWIGTSDLAEASPRGALWCFEADGTVTLGDAGFIVSNGPAFSPDGKTLYFSDTLTRNILAYDLCPDRPFLRNRRVVFSIDENAGYPDGITVDATGCIWVAHWAGACLSRWSPTGGRLETIPIPAVNATSIAFGGPEYRAVYVTTARETATPEDLRRLPATGNVFRIDVGFRGLPEPLFGPGQSVK